MKPEKLFPLIAILMILSALFLVNGCSDDDDDPAGGPSVSVDARLVGTWQANGVTIDGTAEDLADFFEFSEGAVAYHLTINADATYLGEEVDSLTEPANAIDYESGIASSDGQTLTLTVTAENGVDLDEAEVVAEGTWSVVGAVMTFTMVEEGHAIVITWINLGDAPAVSVDEDLVKTWRAIGVTIDGSDVPLADFFEFSEGAATFRITINANATYVGEEVDSTFDPVNVLYTESGIAASDGNVLVLTLTSEDGVDLPVPEVVATGTWAVDGFHMTFTMEQEGQTIVISWVDWNS